jgi:hypothetical protein
MKIKDIKEPIIFIALKKISQYLINNIWTIVLSSGNEDEAELNLAISQSKRHKEDVLKFAKIDESLNWGDQKTHLYKKTYAIFHRGDFNPWYSGDLTLEAFLDSIFLLVEIFNNGENKIEDAEFIHYYKLLDKKSEKNNLIKKAEGAQKIEPTILPLPTDPLSTDTIRETTRSNLAKYVIFGLFIMLFLLSTGLFLLIFLNKPQSSIFKDILLSFIGFSSGLFSKHFGILL